VTRNPAPETKPAGLRWSSILERRWLAGCLVIIIVLAVLAVLFVVFLRTR
jgi:hypothetical protein